MANWEDALIGEEPKPEEPTPIYWEVWTEYREAFWSRVTQKVIKQQENKEKENN